jgi:hypothetical protein
VTQTSALKSASITNLDSTPIQPVDIGEGVGGFLRTVNDYVTALAADAISSTYRLVRFPTNAKVKHIVIFSAAGTNGAADCDVAYSDSTTDGTSIANQGSIVQVSSADNQLFGAAQTLVTTATAGVDQTFAGTYTQAYSNQPMWEVLGLTSDPGGRFDIVLKVTTALTSGGIIGCKLDYVV